MNKKITGIALVLGLSAAFATEADAASHKKHHATSHHSSSHKVHKASGKSKSRKAAPVRAETCSQGDINKRVRADLMMDAATGAVLYGSNEQAGFYQASLTKRMVLLMTLEAIRDGRISRNQLISLPTEYFRNESGAAQKSDAIPFGYTSISVDDAILAMNIRSSNRAPKALGMAIAKANGMAGTEDNFVSMMNARAAQMGLTGTHFVNTTGYPTRESVRAHRTTAVDHARIVQALFMEFPGEMPELLHNSATLTGYNAKGRAATFKIGTSDHFMPGERNALPNILGGKTGYACAAGPAIDLEATIGGRTVIIVTAGHDHAWNRDDFARDLIENPAATILAQLDTITRSEEAQKLAQVTLGANYKFDYQNLLTEAQKLPGLREGFAIATGTIQLPLPKKPDFPMAPFQMPALPLRLDFGNENSLRPPAF